MAKKKDRVEFSEDTKNIIARRAAYRCCFPGCDKTLVGPSSDPSGVTILGECAHIFAAKPDGPRGQHHLTDDQLRSAENGIYLCSEHHTIIDRKKNEKRYPASTLLLFKELHEQKISEEIGQLQYPLHWIKSVCIKKSPILKENTQFNFSKTTILYGTNSTGKSILIEYIVSALRGVCTDRLSKGVSELEIELSNPVMSKVLCLFENGVIRYEIDGKKMPFCPFRIELIYLHELVRLTNRGDDLTILMQYIDCSRDEIRRIVEGCDLVSGYLVEKAWLEERRLKPYKQTTIKLHKKGDSSIDWSYCQFSGQESRSVFLDLLIGYMTEMSRYKNAIFIMDWNDFQTLDDEIKTHYLQLLQQSGLHFQTIMTSHSLWDNVDLRAWNITKLAEDNVEIKWEQLS